MKVIRIQSGKVQTIRGNWIQLAPEGTPDLLVLPRRELKEGNPACPFFIEVKGEKGRLSPVQLTTHNDYRLRGVNVIVAHSIDDLIREGL
jgi:hypothetical protein